VNAHSVLFGLASIGGLFALAVSKSRVERVVSVTITIACLASFLETL
jgi:hypothetical protein